MTLFTKKCGYFDIYFLLFKAFKSDMKTAKKIVNNLTYKNIFPVKGQDEWCLGITNLCQNTHFTE